mmetsp:Transcript_39286/g.108315  ORF Transcript_39286/g.108315 Transcript_39286/m.108315 type:complete len:146 (+) Transcript_39286:449-886(+)
MGTLALTGRSGTLGSGFQVLGKEGIGGGGGGPLPGGAPITGIDGERRKGAADGLDAELLRPRTSTSSLTCAGSGDDAGRAPVMIGADEGRAPATVGADEGRLPTSGLDPSLVSSVVELEYSGLGGKSHAPLVSRLKDFFRTIVPS